MNDDLADRLAELTEDEAREVIARAKTYRDAANPNKTPEQEFREWITRNLPTAFDR